MKYIIGIDEVGRGALAGPVSVTALMLPKDLRYKIKNLEVPLRDSKKLSSRQREIWFYHIKNYQGIFYATASVSPQVIDKINVAKAANLAASRAFQKLITAYPLPITKSKIFLDGGLYIHKPMTSARGGSAKGGKNLKLKTIVRGDEKIKAIMLASIVAKVTRDRRMKRLHNKYPQYGFITNVGYGTRKHIEAIKKYGHSPIHRRSFKIH